MNKYYKDYFLHLKILQYYFGGDLKKAQYIHELSRNLTSTGFELYCVELINKVYGISLQHTGKIGSPDGGLDGIDFKNRVYIQCKKYIIGNNYKTGIDYKGKVSIHEMKDFIASIMIKDIFDKSEGIFITTGFFSKSAKNIAIKSGIICLDFKNLYELTELYSLTDFRKKYTTKNLYKDYQLMFNFQELRSSNEILSRYLKSVREKLCFVNYYNETDNGKIFSDVVLDTFLTKYKIGAKNDFSEFKGFEPSIKKALEIWES